MNTATNTFKPTDVPVFVDRIVRPLTHLFNPLVVRIAGGWWFPNKVLRMRPVAKG